MADNILVTPGTGATVATDDVGGVHYQRSKITLGTDGVATSDLDGTASRGAFVDLRETTSRVQATPVIDTSAHTSGDCLGPLTTVAGMARTSGFGGKITGVQVLDKTQAQRAAMDILLFSQSVTTAATNAPFTCSDADMAFLVAIIPILATDYNTAWPGTPLNSVATLPRREAATSPIAMSVPYVCAATSLFMQLVVRGTPTYTSASDIVVGFMVEPD